MKTIVSRRTLIKSSAATIILPPIVMRHTMAATSIINAVRLPQGGASNVWSAIFGDTKSLGFPIYANQIFMNIAAVFRNSLPAGYPAVYTIAGIYDMLGEPVFQVRLLPPSTAIPGSISNPSLQVLLTAGSQAGLPKVSVVFPEFTKIDGAYHTMQLAVGMLPTNPARFNITAVDVNNITGEYNFSGAYYWTNPDGTRLIANQAIPPAAFNIPMVSSGLPNDTNMVLSIGGPIKDRLGSYMPYGGVNQDLFSAPMDYTQFYLNARPPAGGLPPISLPSVITITGDAASILSSINTANIYASLADNITGLLWNNPPPQTTVQSAYNSASALASSLASTLTTVTKSGGAPSVQRSLSSAQSSIAQARQVLSSMSVTSPSPADMETAYFSVMDAYNSINTAAIYANDAILYATTDAIYDNKSNVVESAYSIPLVNIAGGIRSVRTIGGVGAATVISEGNATATKTILSSGNIVQIDNGTATSALNNQVNNVTMYNGGAPIQPAASDPHVDVQILNVTPNVP